MMGLLLLCEWLSRAAAPTLRANHCFSVGHAPLHFPPRVALREIGAQSLAPAEAPDLYAILSKICARAGLSRVPELFLLPVPDMNAFALGAPDNACITVTRGLLGGLSRAEVQGILAHEVAHIVNRNSCALNWAAAIQSQIASLALRGAAETAVGVAAPAGDGQRSMVLASSPAIARLMFLALSRVRELDADALALDFIDEPRALAAALCKLERFHTGLTPLAARLRSDAVSRSLHSHPDTWERIARIA